MLLDLSAAFDTVEHNVFLTDRKHCVSINAATSKKVDLDFGFHQGSTIGPFGFKLYTKPLTAIAKKHNISIHLYADDTQLYIPFDPHNSEAALSQTEACIEEIRLWMEKNYLKLNDSKTEFVIFGTPHDLDLVTGWTVTVGETEILPSKCARNIGAYLDLALNILLVCRTLGTH